MNATKEYTGFVHCGGTCSWNTGETPTEAATKAVSQFKRDFKHIFKIKKGIEYKVSVFDTTNVDEWVLEDSGYLHSVGEKSNGETIKDFEIVKVYA